jgi:hypothetical protein
MLTVTYAECHITPYAEFRYTQCHYAECLNNFRKCYGTFAVIQSPASTVVGQLTPNPMVKGSNRETIK